VVVAANLIAMLFQALSAKLGVVTGRSLAQLCRAHFPTPVVLAMWIVSEIAAMATDVAETIGAAVALSLLIGLPLLPGLGVVFAITYGLLMLQSRGFRPIELVITGFVGVICLSYLVELAIAPPDWKLFAYHAVVPQLAGPDSLLLAVGIIGATVMPHAIYLHSALMTHRIPAYTEAARRRVLGFSHREVVCALGLAGLVNMAMVAAAAVMFHGGGVEGGQIETAFHTLLPLMGVAAAAAFMISLLASGLSSAVVGTMAGQSIMQDFVGFRIPLWVRRVVTMAPALMVVAIGMNPTQALVLSQVVLSLVLPVPMIALLMLTRRADVMGSFANSRLTQGAALVATVVVLGLNLVLLLQTFDATSNLIGA
jgi:manganese transport protein